MISITKNGIGFAALTLCMYFASMQEMSGLLFLVIGIVVGCFLYNIIASIRNTSALQILPPTHIIAEEGKRLQSAWTIANHTSRLAGFAELKSPWGRLLKIGSVKPGEQLHLSPELTFIKRGVYPYHEFLLMSHFPFGLIIHKRRLKNTGEFIVYPAVYSCEPPMASGFLPMLGGQYTGKYRTAIGDQFHGVRPMQPQDPLKLIHWPSSSKGQGMMVKEFDEQLSGRISLLIDCRHRKTPEGDFALDWAARAAASLSMAALDQGNQLTLVNLGNSALLPVTPFSDPDIVLETLARMRECNDGGVAVRFKDIFNQLPRRSSLCFILVAEEKELLNFIRDNPECAERILSFYIPDFEKESEWLDGWQAHYYTANGIIHGS